MLHTFSNVLVLAPHTDDGELGAGGTLSRLARSGAQITYVAFSIARQSVPEGYEEDILTTEVANATALLGIKGDRLLVKDFPVRHLQAQRQEILDILVGLKKSNSFDLVLTPAISDVHQDHVAVTREAIRAFKDTTVLGYELIWNNIKFESSAFFTLDQMDVDAKCSALSQYISQQGRPYMDRRFVESLCHARGIQIGAEYAEAFEVIRAVWRLH